MSKMPEEKRLVWDIPLRLFHWLFAASIIASLTTGLLGFEWLQWHFYLGYWMIGLLIFRLIWGFIGPRHARFMSFFPTPVTFFRYLAGKIPHSVGHNPAGGAMVIVMLLIAAGQAASGMFIKDESDVFAGPYMPWVSGKTESLLNAFHQFNYKIIIAAIVMHLGAITFYHAVKKQNLVLPMLTGHKPAELVASHEALTSSQLIKAIAVIALSAGLVWFIISHAPPEVSEY